MLSAKPGLDWQNLEEFASKADRLVWQDTSLRSSKDLSGYGREVTEWLMVLGSLRRVSHITSISLLSV